MMKVEKYNCDDEAVAKLLETVIEERGNVDILQAIIEVVVSTHKPRQPTPTLTRSTLRDRLKKCRGAENADPLLVVVLDEASSLLRKSPSDAGPYVAMDRVFSCLKEFPLWLFSLSTESQVGKLLPPDKSMVVEDDDVDDYSMRSLARIPEGYRSSTGSKLRLLPPFVAFPLDISDREKMRNPTAKATELSKPMSQFVRFEHLAMFGRPLWTAYTDHLDLYKLAKLKLTGGHSESFNPENKHEVFAALSFRLSLDVCVENSGSLPLLRTAVGAYMRVVLSVNQRSGYLETTTPSEPILAQAAMDFLCEVTNWQMSIKTLTNNLLREGLIEKGLKGELFARLVMILAQDWIRWKSDPPKSAPPILAPAFSARDFLTSLYAESAHGQIEKIPPKILDGKLNFTHFTSTRENLSPEVIPTLCQDILRRGAALQLAPGQPTYDQLIPFYCGDPDKHYAQSKYGVILIQDKNRAGGTTPDHIFHENFETVVPGTQINTRRRNWNPLESIRKRTKGTSSAPPADEVSCSKSSRKPKIWAVHSHGHSPDVFRCLNLLDIPEAGEAFFANSSGMAGLASDISNRNIVFGHLSRESRSPVEDDEGDENESESGN